MWKNKRNRKSVPKYVKHKNAPSKKRVSPELLEVQKNIYRQAGLALLTIILTIVILFAMTSAWYTNIVQSGGLYFQAESWGFEGEIIVNRDRIYASPGENGLIQLEVQNGSDQISAISVNISKDPMEETMRQRMFFYVDTPMVRNEETMERVYINELESYTYTLFNSGRLMLTDKFHNAAQLKWQWVYDVLGYYVLAERYDVVAQDGTEKQYLAVKEYLRPIEYDYEEATFALQTDEAGEPTYVLTTVDGKTTPLAFLKELSKKDGYPGNLEAIEEPVKNNCYPISVDENGYGIYAYLCSYQEIQEATDYDTTLGELAYLNEHNGSLTDEQLASLEYDAKLIISAQKNETVVESVHMLSQLEKAISQGTADVIQLEGNITIQSDGSPLQISDGDKILLDLNGYSITSKLEGAAIEVAAGSSLTVINGDIIGPDETVEDSSGIVATGAEVVLSKVTMSGFDKGFYLNDHLYSNEQDSNIYMVDCDIKSTNCAMLVSGNGTLSDLPTQVIVENSKLYGDIYGLSGNGDSSGNGRWGTNIQLINSEISSDSNQPSAAIYHPQQNSTLTIYNCKKVSGYTGIAIKGGSVIIEDSIIEGKGTEHYEPQLTAGGFTDTADAVYIETGYEYEILLEIRGDSEFQSTATDSKSLRVFEEGSPYVAVQIYSGKFKEEQPEEYIAPGSVASGDTVKVETETTE